jgi:hypothetical protein
MGILRNIGDLYLTKYKDSGHRGKIKALQKHLGVIILIKRTSKNSIYQEKAVYKQESARCQVKKTGPSATGLYFYCLFLLVFKALALTQSESKRL